MPEESNTKTNNGIYQQPDQQVFCFCTHGLKNKKVFSAENNVLNGKFSRR
jgi:hypothetical protein